MRAVRARAASLGAAEIATEAPASVFLGRARALRPRSTPPRRGSQPHRPSKTSNHTQAHATRRSARSGAARPPAFAPRVCSRGESLASTAATRADRPCVAQRRARLTFGARLGVGNREVLWRLSRYVEKVSVEKYISCSSSAVSKKVFLCARSFFRSKSRSANPGRQKSRNVARVGPDRENFQLHERSIFVLAWTGLAGPGPRRFM